MRSLKLAWAGMRCLWKRNLLFLFELAVVFSVVNVLIAGLNNQTMQASPYQEFFSQKGYFCWSYRSFDREHADQYTPGSIQKQLDGSIHAIEMYLTQVTWNGNDLDCVICDDEIMKRMKLPMVKGKHPGTECAAIISPNAFGLTAGMTAQVMQQGAEREIPISGELTNPTYRPHWDGWEADAGVDLFYRKYDLASEETPFFIMSRSTADALSLSELAYAQSGFLLVYDAPCTDEMYQKNADTLKEYGLIMTSAEIEERTLNTLHEAQKKFIPLGILVLLVALIGFVFHIALQTFSLEKTYAIYYLCGMDWKRIIGLNSIMVLLLLAGSLLLSGGLAILSLHTPIGAQFGLSYQGNNLLITGAICILCFVVAMLTPIAVVGHKTPVDLLRRS